MNCDQTLTLRVLQEYAGELVLSAIPENITVEVCDAIL